MRLSFGLAAQAEDASPGEALLGVAEAALAARDTLTAPKGR
ncbi:hypothetical protein [Streptomyces sp. WMMB303]|nr:hypothetical protein [Streptomyces sp. WMMB303]MDF4252159.1 hypothetical protein [Streptomyces sp. WMMB303]